MLSRAAAAAAAAGDGGDGDVAPVKHVRHRTQPTIDHSVAEHACCVEDGLHVSDNSRMGQAQNATLAISETQT